MAKIITGTYTGTAAALNVSVGFKPTCFKIYNGSGLIGLWTSDMPDASCTLMSEYIDSVIGDPAPGIGTTNTQLANKAFQYVIAGVPYNKAAVAAGTAITATTVPQNKYGLFGFEIAADGTLDAWDAAGNNVGYATAALAIAAKPANSASHVGAFYVVVMNTAAGGFVGATTALNASTVTATYYSNFDRFIKAGGVTPKGGSTDTIHGVQIGTSAYLNTSGATYYYEAILGD
jgi:hypothetical protein